MTKNKFLLTKIGDSSNLYYKSSRTSWQYNNSSNTVNAQAAGVKTHKESES